MPDNTLEVVGLELDTTDVEAGQQRLKTSIEDIDEAYNQFTNTMRLTQEELAESKAWYDETFGSLEKLNEEHAEAIKWNQHYDQVLRSQNQAMQEAHSEALRMNAAFDAQNTTTGVSVRGLGNLNETLGSLARQAAGVHPAIGQITRVLSTLALGAGSTTAVLAFLAALALGWRKVTEAEREAREENERMVASLDDLVAKGGPGGLPGATRGSELRLSGFKEQMDDLRQRIEFNRLRGFGATADRLQEELNEVAFQSAAERERARAGLGATAERLPGVEFEIPRTDEARARAMKRRHDLAVKNLQADLAAAEQAEKAAAAAVLEHDQAVEKLTGQLELERIELTQGEAAAFRASLAMQGWTKAEIDAAAAAFQVNSALREQQEDAEKLAAEDLKELEEQTRATERAMRRMSDGIVDALFDVADGTDSVVEAFADMVESIVRELAREDLERGLMSLLGGFFRGGGAAFSPGEVGAAIDFSDQITPDFTVMESTSAGVREVHHHSVTLNLNAVDGRNAAQFLEANKGTIARLMAQARSESDLL